MDVLFKKQRLNVIKRAEISELLRIVIRLVIESRFIDLSQADIKKFIDKRYSIWVRDEYLNYSRELNNTMYLYAVYKRLEKI